ncbi:hypothetical protein [Kitasatospora sp. NPDC002040]|uniref:hypothetical protein n=1 Tax=Kitasatospora sp. NPDC002040 TaxID=3154661 RepID=UPI00332CEE3B
MPAEFTPHTAGEVTEEIVTLAYEIAEGWYRDCRIDWEDLLYRLDGSELADGRKLWMPDQMTAPSVIALQRAVNGLRRG